MENANRNFSYWLRWLILFPGALFAGILTSFPLHWILYLTLRSEVLFIDPYPEFPERLLFPFVLALVFVWAGYYIAPAYRFRTAIVLAGIWIILTLGLTILALSGTTLMGNELSLRGGGVGSISAIVGAIIGLYMSWKSSLRHGKKEITAEEKKRIWEWVIWGTATILLIAGTLAAAIFLLFKN